MAVPFESAILALPDSAPKLMCDTKMGVSRTMGFSASLPMTVRMLTSASSARGKCASCAPSTRMSSKAGTFICVSMAAPMLCPVSEMVRISSMIPLSCLTSAGSTAMESSDTSAATGFGSSGTSAAGAFFASLPMRTKALLGDLQRGHTQSSGRSSNLTFSMSSS